MLRVLRLAPQFSPPHGHYGRTQQSSGKGTQEHKISTEEREMRKYLSHDTETRELRMVYEDLWEGQHERTEYRVTDQRDNGRPLHGMADLDGTPVLGTAPSLYISGPHGSVRYVWTEQAAIGPTVKTPCRRAGNARRKCALCA